MPRTAPKAPIIRGVARDCTCTPARPHGTHHGYEYHSCGCGPCREGGARYIKIGRYLHANGQQRRRAAGPVRQRVLLLKERGYTVKQIAAEAGVFYTTLFHLLRTDQATVNARTANAVMAIRVPPRAAS